MRTLLVLGHSFPTQHALWEEISNRGIDLHVAYTQRIPKAPDAGPPTFGTPHELPCVPVRGERQTWMAYRGLRPLVNQLAPDVVHVLNEPWSVVVTQVSGLDGVRLVTHGCENLWDQGSRPESLTRKRVTRHNLRRVSGFASWNTEGVTWARRRGLSADRPTIVLSAELPRLERFAEPGRRRPQARMRFGLDTRPTVGIVGRVVREKGVAVLLSAWQLADLSKHAQLLVVGDGPMADDVRAAAQQDPSITFAGPVGFEDIPTVMSALDVLAVPSLKTRDWCEQYGRVITEAMASSVAVVASRSGAIPEVAGDAAVLVDEGSVRDLAEALARLVEDAAWRGSLAAQGAARADTEFSPAKQAERTVSFWEEVKSTVPSRT